MGNSTNEQTFESIGEGLKAGVPLNQGPLMPWLGMGVFQVDDAAAERAVRTAIDLGYRSIDTAAAYGNERGVGLAVRGCGVPRDQLFVTTKLWNADMRQERGEAAFNETMKRLGLEYVDLYLLHWPIAGHIVSSWRVLERLHKEGRVRAIGVSNYMAPHLVDLLVKAEITPAVNQIEFHPYLQSKMLIQCCRQHGIAVEAWSPLMQAGPILHDKSLLAIAQRHGKSVAQTILRWDLQRGIVTIPKSVNPQRLKENSDIFDFALSAAEMAEIDSLDREQRCGADPFNFNF
jgi:diketogulonate reductase-like aldo/keto reductase